MLEGAIIGLSYPLPPSRNRYDEVMPYPDLQVPPAGELDVLARSLTYAREMLEQRRVPYAVITPPPSLGDEAADPNGECAAEYSQHLIDKMVQLGACPVNTLFIGDQRVPLEIAHGLQMRCVAIGRTGCARGVEVAGQNLSPNHRQVRASPEAQLLQVDSVFGLDWEHIRGFFRPPSVVRL